MHSARKKGINRLVHRKRENGLTSTAMAVETSARVESEGSEDLRDAREVPRGCGVSVDLRKVCVACREVTGGDEIEISFHDRERRRCRSGMERPSMA